ncbi:MAG: beta-lactamase family protein [Labilithrix sp.]|nr:beta-lactamase family protein [Labilithrix sp.]
MSSGAPDTELGARLAAALARPRLDSSGVARALVAAGVARDAAVGWAARRGAGWEVSAGQASAEDAPDDAPIFDLASVTKPMTALAVARSRAVARTDRLGDVLPLARGTASASVSLELLLAHRAGLEGHVALYDALVARGVSWTHETERTRAVDRSAALRVAADARRPEIAGARAPADGFPPVYSDLGYALVGEALARAERARDAGEAIERLVAEPLGRADLGTARGLTSRLGAELLRRVRPTEVVDVRGGELRGVVHDENAWTLTGTGGSGHAGMFGTVDAVLAFGCAALDAIARREGALVPEAEEARDLDWLVRARAGGTLRAGFDGKSGSGSSAGVRAGARTFGHLGFTGTSLWIDPDADAVVVVLTNRVWPTRASASIRTARPLAHDALFALASGR